MFLKLSLIILVLIIVSSIIRRRIDSLLFIFACIWSVVIFLYCLKLFDIYDIGENTERIIFYGILTFSLGYLISSKTRFSRSVCTNVIYKDRLMTGDPNVNFYFVKIVFAMILILAASYYIPNILNGFRNGGAHIVKGLIMSGEVSTGNTAIQYIVRPFSKIMIAASTYCIFNHRKQKFIILSGIIMVLFELLGMWSKASMIFYSLCLIVSFLVNVDIRKKFKNKKILIVVISTIVIFFLLVVGLEELYFYASGCIPMLDKIINGTFYTNLGYTYIFLSFNSFFRLVSNVLSLIGIKSELFEIADTYYFKFETTTRVAPDKYYNAFHTMFGDFYVDYGVLGVIILSFVFGIFCAYVCRKYRKTHSLQDHIIFCLLTYYIVFSIVRFQLSNLIWGLALIYAFTILKPILYQRFSFGSVKFYAGGDYSRNGKS